MQNAGRSRTETAAKLLGRVTDDHCQKGERSCGYDKDQYRPGLSKMQNASGNSDDDT